MGTYGQLGNGSTTTSNVPVQVTFPAGVALSEVAGGDDHSLALSSTGTVYAWGDNANGQLGNGSTASSDQPVLVQLPGGVTATAVAAGQQFSLALTSTGSVYAWGDGTSGALGDGATTSSDVPVPIELPGGVTITAVAAGLESAAALTSGGLVYAWGYNASGQLGDGSATDSDVPVEVQLPGGTDATAVASGSNNALALTSAGTIYGWGNNGYGQLGNGTTTSSDVPVLVHLPGGVTPSAIASEWDAGLALTSTGAVYAWGLNDQGDLGNGTLTAGSATFPVPPSPSYAPCSDTPVQVQLPGGVIASAVAGGGQGALALTSAGAVYSWGANGFGQLGDASGAADSDVPVAVALPAGDQAYSVAAGEYHDLVVLGQQSQTINFTSTPPSSPVVGDTYPVSAAASSGLAVTLSVAGFSVSTCSLSGSTVSLFGPGTCTIEANQPGDTAYSAAPQVPQSVMVGRQSQSITFSSVPPTNAQVGDSYTVAATASSGLTVAFTVDPGSTSVCSISAGTTVSFFGVGSCTIDANQAGTSTISPAPQVSQTTGVGRLAQSINFTSSPPASPVVGGTYNVTATATSGLPVALSIDQSTSADCSIEGATVTFLAAATCTIDGNQGGDVSWLPAPQVPQDVTGVGAGSQTVTFGTAAPGGGNVGDIYDVGATATSGLPVAITIASLSAAVCSISGSRITLTGAGTCTIDANQGGDGDWNPATQVTQSISGIAPDAQAVTFTSAAPSEGIVNGTYAVAATASSGLPVAITIDSSSTSECSISGATVTFNTTGTCQIDANQAGDGEFAVATQATQSISVVTAAPACTIEWTGDAGDGLWTTVGNWTSPGGPRLPDSSDVTCIGSLGTTVLLRSSDPGQNPGTLLLGNSNGSDTEKLEIAGSLTLQAGTVYPGATFQQDGTGAITNDGALTVTGSITVATGATFTDDGTVVNDPGGSIANAGTFIVNGNEHFTQDGGTTSGAPSTVGAMPRSRCSTPGTAPSSVPPLRARP
jgi:alpha-tubulin suppressor-like RCC1 family protein